jgi:hypothetical protein
MPAKRKASPTKAKKKSTTRAPTSKDKKQNPSQEIFAEFDPEIESLMEKHKQYWIEDIQEECSKEFPKLSKAGCNTNTLLELLWDIKECDSVYRFGPDFTKIEAVRRLQQEMSKVANKIARLNLGIFALVLFEEKSWRHLLDLPQSLTQYGEVSQLLTEGGTDLTPLSDRRVKQFRNLRVCRVIDYVHEQTGRWYDKELGKLVEASRGYPVDTDCTERHTARHKKFRQRHHKKLKPYLDSLVEVIKNSTFSD